MTLCPICPNKYKCIPGSGPIQSDILCIGEAPGPKDEANGQIFVGPTGQEYDNHLLPLGGLRRGQVRTTNAVKCWPDTPEHKLDLKKPEHRRIVEECAGHFLAEEMSQHEYKYIIPMGATANYALLGERFDLDMEHGIPFKIGDWDIFPMYHPDNLHQLFHIRQDWIRFKKFRQKGLIIWQDEYPNPEYLECTTVAEVEAIDPTKPIAMDTEFTSDEPPEPHCLTYSTKVGTGRLIRASRRDLCDAMARKVLECQEVWFHNYQADRRPCYKMGILIPDCVIRDTMIRMFIIGGMLKGLKPFAYRQLGMKMTDFENVCLPHSQKRVVAYYEAMRETDWPKPEPQMYRAKGGKWKLKQPHSMNTKLRTFFTNLTKNPEKDVIAAWDNWKAEHEMIQEKCGKFVGLDVRDIPFDELLGYACRDADATLRAVPILEEMINNMPGKSPENWRPMWNAMR